jgi:hypothetical protein
MIKESVSLKEVISFLNELLQTDPMAINALFNLRVYCNKDLKDHPTVQVGCEGKDNQMVCLVGFIGILNGLFGIDEKGWGHIGINMDNGKITRFEEYA